MPSSTSADEAVQRLRSLTLSPYEPEPPRAHPLVTFAADLASRRGAALRTPHLCHGSDVDKVEYEYRQGASFLDVVASSMAPRALEGKSVLDVGCGWGGKAVYYAQHMGPARMEGFDLPGVFRPEAALAFAARLGVGGCGFRTGHAEAIPYGDEEFDLLLCDDVLEHVADPGRTLRECCRVLRSGGLLVAVFPSFRMLEAHHLDRVLTWPGLHYLLSMKTWAAGLNHYLLAHEGQAEYEPFDQAVATPFHRCVTRNLNGMSFQQFSELAPASGLSTETLRLLPRATPDNGRRIWLKRLYRVLWAWPPLSEVLSQRVLFVARKP